jgi:hypothetical protein
MITICNKNKISNTVLQLSILANKVCHKTNCFHHHLYCGNTTNLYAMNHMMNTLKQEWNERTMVHI